MIVYWMICSTLANLTWIVSFLFFTNHVISFRFSQYTSLSRSATRLHSILRIALTRELGTNNKLKELLSGFDCYEIPCIQFVEGEDIHLLDDSILQYDLITITSPQAASVFLQSWKSVGKPSGLKVVSVGKGTSKPLLEEGITPVFEPTDATAESLANQLPEHLGKTVLHPTSSIADGKLIAALTARGFTVKRLNTYRTAPADWSDEILELAKSMDIVTFASPSTIKIWSERVGNTAIAVVIGPTSAKAAKEAGYLNIYAPLEGSNGIEPWAELVKKAVQDMSKVSNNFIQS